MYFISKKLKEIVEFVFAVLCSIYMNLSRKNPPRIVLYYHDVKRADTMNFRKQMAYLAEKCIVVTPSTIKIAHANEDKAMVAITFDDAFEGVVNNAVPILKEFKLPAGICVPAGNIGEPAHWEMPDGCLDKNEIVISKEQIEELYNEGFEIFSHTLSHLPLTEIEDRKMQTELVDSKHILEKIVGHEILGISYPEGAYNVRVSEAAQKAGYKVGFTIEPSLVDDSTDNLMIGRFLARPRDGLITFKLKASGAYQVMKSLIALKKLIMGVLGLRKGVDDI